MGAAKATGFQAFTIDASRSQNMMRSVSAVFMSDKEKAKAAVGITSVLNEVRVFPPPKDFSLKAHIKSQNEYRRLYKESIANPDAFWGRMAEKELLWFKPWKQVLK